jgi:hypothetical protein
VHEARQKLQVKHSHKEPEVLAAGSIVPTERDCLASSSRLDFSHNCSTRNAFGEGPNAYCHKINQADLHIPMDTVARDDKTISSLTMEYATENPTAAKQVPRPISY